MTSFRGLLGVCAAVLLAACGSKVDTETTGSGAAAGQGGTGGTGADGGTGGGGGEGGVTSTPSTSGSFNSTINTSSSGGQGGGSNPCDPGQPNVDDDSDGFTESEGDCNDCEASVNPGAVEAIGEPGPNGEIPEPLDEDCDGVVDEPDNLCDDGIALADADPIAGAKAIELCQKITPDVPKWGVLKAAYVRASGAGAPDPKQWGIKVGFGPNVSPQGGQSLLVLSNGHARAPGDPDECGQQSCSVTGLGAAPPGFPQEVPGCPASAQIADDVALQLEIRAPTNATGYSFDFKFYSFEYPEWVCTQYNDQVVALVSPPPVGVENGNITFDPAGRPIGVNAAFVDVCDPQCASTWAQYCGGSCPSLPNPFCALGTAELVGTGFQEWSGSFAGATPWLRTTAPVDPGSVITVRLAIWDAGDQSVDSTVLFDHWQWITNGSFVGVGTALVPDPK